MNFTDKVVVITGGSQGFGRALAEAFLRAGSQVVISSNHAYALKTVSNELGTDYFVSDVAVFNEVKALADYAVKKYGRIDVWVNNAGIQIAPSSVEDVKLDKLQVLFGVNFFGYFYGCKAVLPIMKQQKSGVIVNVNSTAGLDGKPRISAYVASKFAVKGLTQSLREELKDTNIKVYGIFPGGMQTEIYKEEYPADFADYMQIGHAVQKVIDNFKRSEPELDVVIRRPLKQLS